jgi:hypothetical protein
MRTKFRGITGSVEQPTRLELVVNAKAAKALRPHYPPSAPLAHHLRGIDTAPKHKVSRGLATVKPSGGPTQRTATARRPFLLRVWNRRVAAAFEIHRGPFFAPHEGRHFSSRPPRRYSCCFQVRAPPKAGLLLCFTDRKEPQRRREARSAGGSANVLGGPLFELRMRNPGDTSRRRRAPDVR